TQCEPPVQYRSDVCRFGWKSRDRTSGCASVSSNTGGVVPAVVRTAAATSPAPSSCHENATIVDQIDEHTGTAGVLIGTTARSDVPEVWNWFGPDAAEKDPIEIATILATVEGGCRLLACGIGASQAIVNAAV